MAARRSKRPATAPGESPAPLAGALPPDAVPAGMHRVTFLRPGEHRGVPYLKDQTRVVSTAERDLLRLFGAITG